jgi:hypothetical protein
LYRKFVTLPNALVTARSPFCVTEATVYVRPE